MRKWFAALLLVALLLPTVALAADVYLYIGDIIMDASMLGAEYAVVFHENGLADFTLAGTTIQNLPWGLQKVPVGLSTVDAFSINYYSTMFNAALTDSGFDMDYYGTMTLHFVLAE